jgi:hypothetical protein
MMINPDWNYGYLRSPGYGYGAGADPVTAGAAAAEAGFNLISTWKSATEATKQTEIMTRQQRQADRAAREQAVSTQNLSLIALAKGEQEAAAQKELVKNFMLGVAILGVLGTGIYFANKFYFSK